MATVRYYVGQDRERSLIKLYNAISMHQDLVPDIVSRWLVKPVEIDDVPIVDVTLYSDRYGPYELRRMAEELMARLSELENISGIDVFGGQPREIRVELDPQRLAGFGLAPLDIQQALAGADISITAGTMVQGNRAMTVRANSFLTCSREAAELVVGVHGGRPVYLRDVAVVTDAAEDPSTYSRIGFSNRLAREHGLDTSASYPAVTLAIAKKRGTNAVDVARSVRDKMGELQSLLPNGVSARITRDYGATAQDKVSNLLSSLFFAIVTVVLLLAVAWAAARPPWWPWPCPSPSPCASSPATSWATPSTASPSSRSSSPWDWWWTIPSPTWTTSSATSWPAGARPWPPRCTPWPRSCRR